MPDFDVDFCETRRGEVIRYVQERYGHDKVAQIITFGKLKARAVLKDTGRVLQMPYGQVDRLAKLIPNHPTDPWTLRRALERRLPSSPANISSDAEVKRLFDLAMKLEGLPRHASTHAAGVVIGDRPLAQLVPLYRDPRSDMPVTQFDMKYVEAAGLVKFDFLGLKTLSVLKKAVDLLAKRGVEVDLDRIDLDDPAVYEMLQRGDTVGVFQLESEGMRRTLAAVKPTSFEDIIALVSLYRPGPMDSISALRRAQERPRADQLSASTARDRAQGYIRHLRLPGAGDGGGASVLAGFSLGEADLLRRAMGKKIKAEMDAQRAGFVEGCERVNAIPEGQGQRAVRPHRQVRRLRLQQLPRRALRAARLSDRLAEAALSGRILRRLDVLRHARRPTSSRIFVDDMRRTAIALPAAGDQPQRGGILGRGDGEGHAVRYALGALKGVGEKAMEQLVAEREANGAFAEPRRFRRADRSAPAEPPPDREPRRRRRLRRASRERWAVHRGRRDHPRRRRKRRRCARPAGRAACSARGRPMSSRSECRPREPGPWPSAWPPRRRASASISRPIRSTITAISPRPTAPAASPISPPCRRRPTAAAPAR